MRDTSPSPLVLTKFAPPRTRLEHVDRRDLRTRLAQGREALTLLNAPAGYGKTTLLSWWQQADPRRPFAWISLDEGDRDPRRFWSYVGRALSPPGAPAPRAGADILPNLINMVAAQPRAVVLVLDDYHCLGDSEVHEQLALLLERGPPNLRVVLSTREDPPFPLARLRAHLALAELTARDLRFDAGEAAALLNDRLGLGLGDEGIARLLERTDGWPAGLYLAGLALRERPDRERELERLSDGRRHLMDYFATEVLAGLSPDERAFLRRAAALPEISGPLLDAVLETEGSGERLRRLERTNLLLPRLEGESEWYRLHVTFGELLRSMLAEEEPELIPELHLRASAWYAAPRRPRAGDRARARGGPSRCRRRPDRRCVGAVRRLRPQPELRELAERAVGRADRGRPPARPRRRVDRGLGRVQRLVGRLARAHHAAGRAGRASRSGCRRSRPAPPSRARCSATTT